MPDIFFEKAQEVEATTPDAIAMDIKTKLDQTGLKSKYSFLTVNGVPSANNVPEDKVAEVRNVLEAAGFIVKQICYNGVGNAGMIEMI